MATSKGEKIKIICRIRPFLNHETDDQVVHVTDNNTITLENKRDPSRPFIYKSFSSCYSPDATQEVIFTQDVLPMIERVFEGYSGSVFTYGVTGSGKSYSLVGEKHDPGIIPRVANFLFESKQATQISSIDISMSYMEILKESVFDMLVPNHKDIALDIREDGRQNVFVANLKEEQIETYGDFLKLFSMANKNRSTASTKLNSRSSRSHAILTFYVKLVTPTVSEDGQQHEDVIMGKINLIDLAGSEDNKKTGNEKVRMKESAAINKSLLALGQVVEALNTGASRIPFRNSKLTRILQPTLGGTSLGMMMINIAPGHNFINDTTNTLNFANRTKEIKSTPKVNTRRTKTFTRLNTHVNNTNNNNNNISHPARIVPPTPTPITTKYPTNFSRRLSTPSDNSSKRRYRTYEEIQRNAKRPRHSLQPNTMPLYRTNPSITSSPSHRVINRRLSIPTTSASTSMHRLQQWLEEISPHSSPSRQSRTSTSVFTDDDEELVTISKADWNRIYDELKIRIRQEVEGNAHGTLV